MSDQLTSISSLSGLEMLHTLQGHTDVITRIAWSPDGRTLASTSKDGTLRLWNLETGELCRTVEANVGSIYNVAWSPNGKTLAIASHNGSIQLRNAETSILSQAIEKTPTSLETTSTQQKQTLPICGIAFSPNGQILALTGTSNDIEFFKIQQGLWIEAAETLEDATILAMLEPMRHTIQEGFRHLDRRERVKMQREIEQEWRHMVFERKRAERVFKMSHRQSQLHMRVASVLQKLQRGIPLPSVHFFTDLIAQKPLHSIEWSPGGETLAFTFYTDIDLYSVESLLEPQSLPVDSISLDIARSPDGQTLSSACLDGTVQLWNIKTGARIRILEGHTDAVV